MRYICKHETSQKMYKMGDVGVLKRIAVGDECAGLIQKLAATKGLSMGKYLQNLMEYVSENGIDYSDMGASEEQTLRKEIDRPVKILRAFEKTYLFPLLDNVKFLTEHLTPLVNEVANVEGTDEQFKTESQTENEQLKNELSSAMEREGLFYERLRWLVKEKAEKRKGGIMIEITQMEYELYVKDLERYVR